MADSTRNFAIGVALTELIVPQAMIAPTTAVPVADPRDGQTLMVSDPRYLATNGTWFDDPPVSATRLNELSFEVDAASVIENRFVVAAAP